MKAEHKSHKEVGHWPYLAIVAIVAVVAVVFLVMNFGSNNSAVQSVKDSSTSDDYSFEGEIVDDDGNIVGEAFRYRGQIKVGERDPSVCKIGCNTCTVECSENGGSSNTCWDKCKKDKCC